MAGKITLSNTVRNNLITLQGTAKLIGQTNNRLSTGLKVSSAVDDPLAYFTAKTLNDNGDDFTGVKDNIDQAISTVKTALDAIDAVTDIVKQMKGLVNSARGADTTTRADLATQFGTLRTQLDNLVGDANYNGTNLLKATPDSLTVNFNPDGSNTLTIAGVDITTANSGLSIAGAAGSWASDANIDAAQTDLDAALTTLRSQASTFGSNIAIMTTRLDFTSNIINDFQEGAGKLTNADLNEEGANLLALQTRQQLGINSLSLASQSEQSVLGLF